LEEKLKILMKLPVMGWPIKRTENLSLIWFITSRGCKKIKNGGVTQPEDPKSIKIKIS
jgi:hypothetical protein